MLASLPLMAALAGFIQSPAVDELTSLARVGPESVLAARARDRPNDVRDALRRLFIQAANDPSDTIPLIISGRLVQAYTLAWRDSFLLRQVAWFAARSPSERRSKVRGDSLRRAGNDALSRVGVQAALLDWREGLARYQHLADSAGTAATFGNIGAGFYEANTPDSAEDYLQRSRQLAERIGDYRTLGNAIGTLGAIRMDRGDLRGASEFFSKAAELRKRTGDDRGAAADQNNVGLIAQELGDWNSARLAFADALALNRAAGRDEPAAANLMNLANVDLLAGEYSDAETRYDEALALYRAHDNHVDEALVLHNLGLLNLARGDYRAALSRLRTALALYQKTGPPSEVIAVRRHLASALSAMGDLQGALEQLNRAARLAGTSRVTPDLRASLAMSRADLATEFNDLGEAERHYGEAGRLYHQLGDAAGQAAAQQGAGVVLLLDGEYIQAQAVLQLALLTKQTTGDVRGAALARLLVGYALQHSGDTASARAAVTQALDSLRAFGDLVGEASALQALGELEADAGLTLAAESLYRRGVARLANRPVPILSWQLHAGLGRVLHIRGALAQGATEFETAIAALEQVSGRIPFAERRSAFLADKWDVYAQLALIEEAQGHTAAAFQASERLRAREMLDLLARGRVGPVARDSIGGDVLTREQDLRRRIASLTQMVASTQTGSLLRGSTRNGDSLDAAREALARAQESYVQLLSEARASQPEYAALVRGDVTRPADLAQRLAPDEALVEYLVSDSTTLAFVVTAESLAVVDLNVGRHALVTLIDFVRGTLSGARTGIARTVWRAPLRRLHQYLIGPLESAGLLRGVRALLIAPHAELHYLPFAALLESTRPDHYLVERYLITYVPSASVLVRLRERVTDPAPAGVLAFAPRAMLLPGSATEVAAIGRIFGSRARVLVGSAASELAFRELAPSQGIVHLATFGVLNKDNPLFSFVELAPHGDDDGRLEVHEVFGLTLRSQLVVLSACRTALGAGALGDVPEGDDWVGLVRAFLYAGAGNVMATLWPVEDRSTAQLVEKFYTDLAAGRPAAEALAEAQRAIMSNPVTSHPFYWAGFTMSGR